jgi:tRNA-Thr(GGU) m(6)t(6)A37 methyltransferase TsaA
MTINPIGTVHTPYTSSAPYQAPVEAKGEFYLEIENQYSKGLYRLESFRYIYCIVYLDRINSEPSMKVRPPWAEGLEVGLFASRSPRRPNPLGLSIVRVLGVEGNRVLTGPMDFFDGTPLLDIKPYIQELDNREDANLGWAEGLSDREHLMLHIRGIPH